MMLENSTINKEKEIEQVLIKNLLKYYDPYPALGFYSKITIKQLKLSKPIENYIPEEHRPEEDLFWHLGRIRYFFEQIRQGKSIDPIEIDNFCNNGSIYPEPIVTDGHHRLIASDLVKARTIPVIYGGRVDVLNYLVGKSKKIPES